MHGCACPHPRTKQGWAKDELTASRSNSAKAAGCARAKCQNLSIATTAPCWGTYSIMRSIGWRAIAVRMAAMDPPCATISVSPLGFRSSQADSTRQSSSRPVSPPPGRKPSGSVIIRFIRSPVSRQIAFQLRPSQLPKSRSSQRGSQRTGSPAITPTISASLRVRIAPEWTIVERRSSASFRTSADAIFAPSRLQPMSD